MNVKDHKSIVKKKKDKCMAKSQYINRKNTQVFWEMLKDEEQPLCGNFKEKWND